MEYGNKATTVNNQLFQLTKTTAPVFFLAPRKDDAAASWLLDQPFNESRCAMKYGILMILGLLLTTLSMTGCDVVGDNEPNVSREALERIQSSPQDLSPSINSLLEVLSDSISYESISHDTLK